MKLAMKFKISSNTFATSIPPKTFLEPHIAGDSTFDGGEMRSHPQQGAQSRTRRGPSPAPAPLAVELAVELALVFFLGFDDPVDAAW